MQYARCRSNMTIFFSQTTFDTVEKYYWQNQLFLQCLTILVSTSEQTENHVWFIYREEMWNVDLVKYGSLFVNTGKYVAAHVTLDICLRHLVSS